MTNKHTYTPLTALALQ